MTWNKLFIFFIFIILSSSVVFGLTQNNTYFLNISQDDNISYYSGMPVDDCFIKNYKGGQALDHGCFIKKYGHIVSSKVRQMGINIIIIQLLTLGFGYLFKKSKNDVLRGMALNTSIIDYMLLNLFVLYVIFVL